MAYYAVPMSGSAISAFRHHMIERWHGAGARHRAMEVQQQVVPQAQPASFFMNSADLPSATEQNVVRLVLDTGDAWPSCAS